VRDYLLLELPMQPRCEDPEGCVPPGRSDSARTDQGARSTENFGEAAVDPRLMPLKKLVKSEPEKE
jgi:uncharacterized metal-binding protein YceD (DUF177 family)